MPKLQLDIPFSLEEDPESQDAVLAMTQKRFEFWTSSVVIDWFCHQGYTLYTRQFDDGFFLPYSVPALPSQGFVEGQYPYACYDDFSTNGNSLRVREQMGKVVFAQDAEGRHVAIKLVRSDSDELCILHFLQSQGLEALKENCVLPIFDFLPVEGHHLVVMPRWGTVIHLPHRTRIREAIQIMHSMLKALVFLHNHNIIHRDVKFDNVAVNHFSDVLSMYDNTTRQQLRESRSLLYAMFDFDLSIMIPPDVDKRRYRLPYQMSWCGTYSHPPDTAQGEFDYDPFAFDVGTMGIEFCSYYQHVAKDIPMLAPFLDRMTTRNISSRFTATEALRFFEKLKSELTDVQLDTFCEALDSHDYYEEYDRWQHLSPEFKRKWAAFRETPVPLTTKILRRICENNHMVHIVPSIRWFFYTLWTNPRRIFSSLFPWFRL